MLCDSCGAATDEEVAELYNRLERLTAENVDLRNRLNRVTKAWVDDVATLTQCLAIDSRAA